LTPELARTIGFTDEAVVELVVTAALAVSANAIVDALSIHRADRETRTD